MNAMHDYAIFGHDRSSYGRWFGVISISIAGGIAQLLAWTIDVTGFEAFSKATFTTGSIYFLMDWLFCRFGWKLLYFQIPNLDGKWLVKGYTLNEVGECTYEWNGELAIEQNWKTILIHLKTDSSQSRSYTATLLKNYGHGGWILTYSYRNDPGIEFKSELISHKGYCEIEFDSTLQKGNGTYFNNGVRNSFGMINLTKG